jgi:hypothetical protein
VRILKQPGAPVGKPQWWFGCNVYGQPQAAGDRSHGIDLKDCQTRFKVLWARIRARLTDEDIARAGKHAEQEKEWNDRGRWGMEAPK